MKKPTKQQSKLIATLKRRAERKKKVNLLCYPQTGINSLIAYIAFQRALNQKETVIRADFMQSERIYAYLKERMLGLVGDKDIIGWMGDNFTYAEEYLHSSGILGRYIVIDGQRFVNLLTVPEDSNVMNSATYQHDENMPDDVLLITCNVQSLNADDHHFHLDVKKLANYIPDGDKWPKIEQDIDNYLVMPFDAELVAEENVIDVLSPLNGELVEPNALFGVDVSKWLES